jgi:hypothetical protein
LVMGVSSPAWHGTDISSHNIGIINSF